VHKPLRAKIFSTLYLQDTKKIMPKAPKAPRTKKSAKTAPEPSAGETIPEPVDGATPQAADQPVSDNPVSDNPMSDNPVSENPVSDAAATEEPAPDETPTAADQTVSGGPSPDGVVQEAPGSDDQTNPGSGPTASESAAHQEDEDDHVNNEEAHDEYRDYPHEEAEGQDKEGGDARDVHALTAALVNLKVDQKGEVKDEAGQLVGRVVKGTKARMAGKRVDEQGNVKNTKGKVVGRVEAIVPDATEPDVAPDAGSGDSSTDDAPPGPAPEEPIEGSGETPPASENATEDATSPDARHNDTAAVSPPPAEGEAEKEKIDYSHLTRFPINKLGNILDSEGVLLARVIEGTKRKMVGRKADGQGRVWNDSGKIIGRVELVTAEEQEKAATGPFTNFPDAIVDADGNVVSSGRVIGKLTEGDGKKLQGAHVDEDGDVLAQDGSVIGRSVVVEEEEPTPPQEEDLSALEGMKVTKLGFIISGDGVLFGKLVEGDAAVLAGRQVDAKGQVWGDLGKVVGRAALLPAEERKKVDDAPFEDFPNAKVRKDGLITADGKADGEVIGRITEGDPKKLAGKKVDASGDVLDRVGNLLGKAERYEVPPEEEPAPPEEEDLSALEGMRVTKLGFVISSDGVLFGKLVEGDATVLAGRPVDGKGQVWGDLGKVVGRAVLLPAEERKKVSDAPFEDFPNAKVQKDGLVTADGKADGDVIGRLVDGDATKLKGKKVDSSGDILDRAGNVMGRAERYEVPQEEEEAPVEVDRSSLAGKRVNKAGNLVDGSGTVFGKVVEGDVKELVGKSCNAKGEIFNDEGVIIGRADLLEGGPQFAKGAGPFAGYSDIKVGKDGLVRTAQGEVVGRLTDGDPAKLANRPVDEDGDILSAEGNVEGHAERYELPEEEAVEKPAGPLAGLKVTGDGKVYDAAGEHVAQLTSGEAARCAGKEIDDDNDVLDTKGAVIGHVTLLKDIAPPAEDIQPPAEEAPPSPPAEEPVEEGPKSLLDGCTVMANGDAFNAQGQLMGKLTDGTASVCAGKRVNEHGLVVDGGGNVLGRVTLLSDIPAPEEPAPPEPEPEPEEPEEDPEEKEKREKLERDRKLAIRMSGVIQGALDKLRPILRQITSHLENARQVPKGELDEEALVSVVRPLLEKGGSILDETLNEIRDMDPTGEAQNNARGPTDRDPLPEEQRLAKLLSTLTQDVTETLDHARTSIAGMPHAKEELTPKLGLLSGPLGKILGAVGLILSAVFELLGGLLGGLGLGDILGSLGLGNLLGGVLGGVTSTVQGVTSGVTSAVGGLLG
jgi:hypothetical protein